MRNRGSRYERTVAKWGYEGVTISMRNRATGELLTTHGPSWSGEANERPSTRKALQAALAWFEPDEWQVLTISTPQTIYDDLTFRRKLIDPADGYRGNHRSGRRLTAFSEGGTIGPEEGLLKDAGLLAFL